MPRIHDYVLGADLRAHGISSAEVALGDCASLGVRENYIIRAGCHADSALYAGLLRNDHRSCSRVASDCSCWADLDAGSVSAVLADYRNVHRSVIELDHS